MEQKAQRKSMIKVRGGYSDKNGYNVVCNSLQVDDFDDRTRVVICNKLYELCEYIFETHNKKFNYSEWGKSNRFCKDLLTEVFNVSTALEYDSKYDWRLVFKRVEGVTLNALKNEVLDIVWFMINWFNDNTRDLQVDLQKYFNFYLEKECVGYRFVDMEIVNITDDEEIETINTTCNSKYNSCKIHIKKALGFLSDRNNPDYKNSIKESISAVESVCQIITNDEKATLGEAIKHIEEKGIKLHKALKNAFSALYGYTSNEGGIRHAEGMFESNVTFDEAKYMLVSCCAFVNYLIGQYSKIK